MDARGGLGVIVARKRCGVVAMVMTVLLASYAAVAAGKVSEPVDYVSPNIGTIGQLLTATVPYVQMPHGMAPLAPITTPGIMDRYLASKIYAFPAGPAWLMAATGKTSTHPENYASSFDHDFETATPYYYEADLQSSGIKVEFTATQTAAYYRFTLPADGHAHLVLSLEKGSELKVVGVAAVEGSQKADGTVSQVVPTKGETRGSTSMLSSRSRSDTSRRGAAMNCLRRRRRRAIISAL